MSPAVLPPAFARLHALAGHALQLLGLLGLPATGAALLARRVADLASADDLARWLADAARDLERRVGQGGAVVFRAKMAKVLPESLGTPLRAA